MITLVLMVTALILGFAFGWVVRSDVERGYIGQRLAEKHNSRDEDDARVMTWLEDHGSASLAELTEYLPIGTGRIRDALDRLQRDGIISSGYAHIDNPHMVTYWRDWKAGEEPGCRSDKVRGCTFMEGPHTAHAYTDMERGTLICPGMSGVSHDAGPGRPD